MNNFAYKDLNGRMYECKYITKCIDCGDVIDANNDEQAVIDDTFTVYCVECWEVEENKSKG